MSGVTFVLGRRAVPCLVALSLAGCELGQSLQEIANALGNPGAETVDGEGELVREGNFRALRFDGNNPDGIFVVAIEAHAEAPQSRLRLIPFPEADGGCTVGAGVRFAQAKARPSRAGRAKEARIPFVVPASDGEPQRLRFTNFDCELDSVSVADSSLPLDTEFANQPGFIAQTSTQELYFVDPWNDEKRLLARNLTPNARNDLALFAEGASGQWMWTIEDGELVARDADFREMGRVGTEVLEFQHLAGGSAGPRVAYRQANGAAFTVLASELDQPVRVESDACALQLGSGPTGQRLTYFAPCSGTTVVMTELSTGTRTVLAEGAGNYRIIGDRSDGPVVLYVSSEDGNGVVGTLWARFGLESPVRVGAAGHLGLTRLTTDGTTQAVLDWGANGGVLRRGQLGEELTTLARDVVYYSSIGVIGQWDGTVGSLYQFDGEELVRVQRRVSTRGIKWDNNTKRGLVLADFDGFSGNLTLIKDGQGSLLSENVRPDSYQFTVQLPTVTVLRDLDEETGTATLELRDVEGDGTTVVSEGVAEVLEVSWPKAGLLYSVPLGDRAGIWFTEAR